MSLVTTVVWNARRCAWFGALIAATILFVPTPANGQSYPTRPVNIIVPYFAGSPDVTGRLIAERLSEYFGKPFIVENRPGAGGILGIRIAIGAKPDGHTLLLGAMGALTLSPTLSKTEPFKTTDLVPISLICAANLVMLTAPSLSDKSLNDIIELAKKSPGKLTFASAGYGTEHHMLLELFQLTTGARVTHVPYQGFTKGSVDVLSDRVQLIFSAVTNAVPHVQSKRLGAVAVTGARRDEKLPDIPTFTELGYPQIQLESWFGLLAPKDTPGPAVQRLTEAMDKIVRSTEFAASLAKYGLLPMKPGPKALADRMQADTKYWRDIIVRGNIEKM